MAGNGQSLPSGRALAACGKRLLYGGVFGIQAFKQTALGGLVKPEQPW